MNKDRMAFTAVAMAAVTTGALGLVSASPAAAATAEHAPGRRYHGVVICIDRDADVLRLMVDGRRQIRMSVRFGSHRYPTRTGSFRIQWKDRDHISKLYGSAMPFSMFFDNGQAIHYSEDFAARGYRGASHGCVNTRDYEATADLFTSVHEGTRVIIYGGQ